MLGIGSLGFKQAFSLIKKELLKNFKKKRFNEENTKYGESKLNTVFLENLVCSLPKTLIENSVPFMKIKTAIFGCVGSGGITHFHGDKKDKITIVDYNGTNQFSLEQPRWYNFLSIINRSLKRVAINDDPHKTWPHSFCASFSNNEKFAVHNFIHESYYYGIKQKCTLYNCINNTELETIKSSCGKIHNDKLYYLRNNKLLTKDLENYSKNQDDNVLKKFEKALAYNKNMAMSPNGTIAVATSNDSKIFIEILDHLGKEKKKFEIPASVGDLIFLDDTTILYSLYAKQDLHVRNIESDEDYSFSFLPSPEYAGHLSANDTIIAAEGGGHVNFFPRFDNLSPNGIEFFTKFFALSKMPQPSWGEWFSDFSNAWQKRQKFKEKQKELWNDKTLTTMKPPVFKDWVKQSIKNGNTAHLEFKKNLNYLWPFITLWNYKEFLVLGGIAYFYHDILNFFSNDSWHVKKSICLLIAYKSLFGSYER